MKIACIGWGSLTWRPNELLIQRKWFEDGPIIPLEFVRQSKDGTLTLVITEKAKPVRTLWALMYTDNLETAKISLLEREGKGIPRERLNEFIKVCKKDVEVDSSVDKDIKSWLITKDLDATIWTNLPPKFNKENNKAPSLEDAISYLRGLKNKTFNRAKEYIEKAPMQIDTEYRRAFEKEFNWERVT